MSLQFECDAKRFSATAEDIENSEKKTWVEEVLMQLDGSLFCWEIEREEKNNKRKILRRHVSYSPILYILLNCKNHVNFPFNIRGMAYAMHVQIFWWKF